MQGPTLKKFVQAAHMSAAHYLLYVQKKPYVPVHNVARPFHFLYGCAQELLGLTYRGQTAHQARTHARFILTPPCCK